MKHASMNRIYRLVWNTALGLWVAVAENAKGAGKGGSARRAVLALAALLAAGSPLSHAADAAHAAVTAGTGNVSTTGAVTTINQASTRLAIDWSKLSTTPNEALVFRQPNASSIALNRVTGSDPSQLLGSLTANGQVFVLNPNGVMFGPASQVNVGGLVASTLSLSNDDFMAGKFSFANNGSSGSVINQGSLTAGNGGYLALLAPEVRNEGVMTATLGTSLLAAGNKITLKLDTGSLLGYSIDQGAVKAQVDNGGIIRAGGGQVLLTATALDALTTASVNNTGFIEAQTVQNKAGRIVLLGDMGTGTVHVAGTLDASAPAGGNGGFIETSGHYVITNETAKITTRAPYGRNGTLLVDPDTFTINNGGADSGGGANSFYSNTYLSGLLVDNSVTIATTSGSHVITVNGAVSWNSANTLSLVNNATFSTPASIAINAALTFPNGELVLNSTGTISASAAITGNILTFPFGTWVTVSNNLPVLQVNDFRFSPTANISGVFIRAVAGNGSAANPYQLTDIYGVQGMTGDSGTAGQKSFILANNIDASGTRNWNGGDGFMANIYPYYFYGAFDGKGYTINNLKINRPTEDYVAMFSGIGAGGSVRNVGLVNISVLGASSVGGLAGDNLGTVDGVYVTGSVRSYVNAGQGIYPQITGGLVGNNLGSISNSYVTANVTGSGNTGGLVGSNGSTSSGTGSITNSYATGTVFGNGGYNVGGLVGDNAGTISNSYAAGPVSGFAYVGGLVGSTYQGVVVTNSFWDTAKTGRASSAGGTGKTTAQMMTASTFTGWSMNSDGSAPATVWRIYEGHAAPLLRSFLTPSALGLTTVTYDGAAHTATAPTGSNVFGTPATGTNAGSYTGVYWSNQQGYDFSGSASLTISPRALSVTGGRGYDGTTSISAANLSLLNLVGGETLALSGTGSFADKNAGASKPLNISGLSLADGTGAASNYTFVGGTWQASISKRVLNISGGRTYDGTTNVSAAGNLTLGNLVGAETLNLGGTALLDDKNAGTHTTLGTGGLTLSDGTNGGLAGNYTLSGGSQVAVIAARTLNVTTTGVNKVYDGNTNAVVIYGSNKIAGDTLSFSNSASNFASKNVGTGIGINVTGISAGGLDAGNYVLAGTTSYTSANITARTINVTTTGVDKVYDGNTNALVTYGSDKVAGDTLTFSNTASNFASKNVGTGVAISVAGLSASGADAGNYVLASTTSSTSANITARTLNVTTTGVNKVYDGTTNAIVTYGSDKVAGDTLNFTNTASNFAGKNVGSGIGINVTGISASGTDAGNYVLSGTTSSTSANITARTLNITTTGVDKVYDGNTNAVVTYGSDKITGDTLSFSNTSSTFANRNVGTGVAISVTGLSASGADAGNYVLASSNSSTSANITPKALTVTANNDQRAFTGAPYSGGKGVSYSGFVAGDGAANITGTPVYSGSSQGAFQIGAYAITPGGLSAQWGNYALSYSSGMLLITPTAYLNFQGLSSLFNAYACNFQAVKGFGGTQGAGSTGCSTLSTAEAMAAQLATTAADNAP